MKTVLPWAIGAVVLGGSVVAYNHHQREIGALKFKLAAQDSTHRADSARAIAVRDTSAKDRQKAGVARVASRSAVTAAVVKATAETVVFEATRDSVMVEAADTSKTAEQLRTLINTLDYTITASTRSRNEERAVWKAALDSVIVRDSVALASSSRALLAMETRATSSEKTVKLMQADRPSKFWKWAERVGWASAVTYLATQKK